ncbi:HU family DNA-binding protein, partial [Candidatus Phytoplasma australasiaticum]
MSDALTHIYRGTYFFKEECSNKTITKRRNNNLMTKKELIKKIAEAKHASITKTTEFYHTFEKTLSEAITSHAEVILSPQIGKFVLKAKKAY